MCRIAKEIDTISIPPHIFHTGQIDITPAKFNSEFTPEKWCLEEDHFLFGFPNNFSGDQLAEKNFGRG